MSSSSAMPSTSNNPFGPEPEITLFSILPSTSSPTMSANNPPHSLHKSSAPPFTPQQLQTIHALSFPPPHLHLTSKHCFALTTSQNTRWYGYCLTIPFLPPRLSSHPLINCRGNLSRRPTPGDENNLRRAYIIISPSPSGTSTFFPLLSTLPFSPNPTSLKPMMGREERLLPLFLRLDSSSYTLLLTSLMLERRVIIFGEDNPSLEVMSLLHVLSLFKLNYRGLFLPTLPENLTEFVHAPTPYIIAVRTQLAEEFQRNPDIKDVIYVNVDNKTVYGNCLNITECTAPVEGSGSTSQKMPATFVDKLIQGFDGISKGIMKDESRGSMQEGVKAVGKSVNKIKGWMNTKIQRRGSGLMSNPLPNPAPPAATTPLGPFPHNPRREIELRQTLVTFFGYLLSDARLFTRRSGTGFSVDKDSWVTSMSRKFGRNVGMSKFCSEFSTTRMFIDHCDDRIASFGKDTPEASLSSLMLKTNSLEFAEIFKSISGHFQGPKQDPIKDLALKLTSNSAFKGHYYLSLDKVVSNMNESVWDVIWDRLEDSKTFNWKHGLLGLQMLKAVMIWGGPATVERVWERFDLVRRLMKYGNGISGQGKAIEKEARDVFRLASDLNYLKARRDHKRVEDSTTYRWKGESLGLDGKVKMISGTAGFKSLHSIIAPPSFKTRGAMSENVKFATTLTSTTTVDKVEEVAGHMDLLDFGFSGSNDAKVGPFSPPANAVNVGVGVAPAVAPAVSPAVTPKNGNNSSSLKRPSIGAIMNPPTSSIPHPAGLPPAAIAEAGSPMASPEKPLQKHSPLRRPTAAPIGGFSEDPFALVGSTTNKAEVPTRVPKPAPASNGFDAFNSNSGGPSFQQQDFASPPAAPDFSPPPFPQQSQQLPGAGAVGNGIGGFAASNGFDAFNSNSGGPGFTAFPPPAVSSPPLQTIPLTPQTMATQSPFGTPTVGGGGGGGGGFGGSNVGNTPINATPNNAHMNISMMQSVVGATEEKKKKEMEDDPFAQFAQF